RGPHRGGGDGRGRRLIASREGRCGAPHLGGVEPGTGTSRDRTVRWRGAIARASARRGGIPAAGRGGPGDLVPRYRVFKRMIAKGLTYLRLIDRSDPERVFVLKIEPDAPVTLDLGLARRR